MTAQLSPSQFAKSLGPGVATDRQIRNLCAEGMPGVMKGERNQWLIDPALATPWISDPANANRISGRIPIPLPPASSRPAAGPALQEQRSGGLTSVLERHISDMDALVGVLLQVMTGSGQQPARFDPRAVTMMKQTITEIRMAETHALQMRQADQQMIARERHNRICATLATVFRQDLELMVGRWPDVMLAKMTEAGIAIADPAAALKVLRSAAESEVFGQLTRLADQFQRMDLESFAAT